MGNANLSTAEASAALHAALSPPRDPLFWATRHLRDAAYAAMEVALHLNHPLSQELVAMAQQADRMKDATK